MDMVDNNNNNSDKPPQVRKKRIKSKIKDKPPGPYTKALLEVQAKKKLVVDERLLGAVIDTIQKEQKPVSTEELDTRDERIYYLTGKGKQHPVHEIRERIRNVLLNSGFNELENQYFVPEKDIFEQYDLKSGLVLDETYYLGETQKIKINLTPEHLTKFEDSFLHSNFNKELFLKLVNDYNENNLNITQFFQRLKDDLEFSNVDIDHLIDELPELKSANPRLMSVTLRSKMDSPWFSTLKAIMDRDALPIKVFSIGLWFKRESIQSELFMKSHYGVSCVIMDDDINLNIGKVIIEELLERLGFKEFVFKSNEEINEYKIHQKELDVYRNNIKIASCGTFSKKLLANFDIDIPVLYINFGLEHLVMSEEGMDDIQELMYPQFHSAWKMKDIDIANAIQFIQVPKTKFGKEIAANIYEICMENYNSPSPCEYTVWEGAVQLGSASTTEHEFDLNKVQIHKSENDKGADLSKQDNRLIIKVLKKEKGNRLCGPAALNEIVIKNGDIYGANKPEKNPELAGAVNSRINYIRAFSNYVGSEIEKQFLEGTLVQSEELKIGIIKEMDDINLQLDGRAIRFVSSNNKKIDVRGPMFVNVEYKLEPIIEKMKKIMKEEESKEHKADEKSDESKENKLIEDASEKHIEKDNIKNDLKDD